MKDMKQNMIKRVWHLTFLVTRSNGTIVNVLRTMLAVSKQDAHAQAVQDIAKNYPGYRAIKTY